MPTVKLKYIKAYIDRHGKKRAYFRRRGYKTVALPGEILSEEFMAAYHAALKQDSHLDGAIPVEQTIPGSVLDALERWYDSKKFNELEPKTQLHYRQIMQNALKDEWHKPVKLVRMRHIDQWMADIMKRPKGGPGAANNFLKRAKTFFRFCVKAEIIDFNPAAESDKINYETEGFVAWERDDISAYIKKWAPGTKQYLCVMLLAYTGQRISDIATMRADDLKDGRISIMQAKLRRGKTRVKIKIKVHPALKTALSAFPREPHETFLITEYGKPFSAKGLSQDFSKWARDAGLPKGKTAHGLRKYAGKKLAEAGATAHQIMAVLGLNSLREAERYTQSANKIKLADDAMDLID